MFATEELPHFVEGVGLAVDDRGNLLYINDIPEDVRRMYVVHNDDTTTVRAWHGHLHEAKYACVLTGKAILGLRKIWKQPVGKDSIVTPWGLSWHPGGYGLDSEVTRIILSGEQPRLLRIPAGYANGARALVPGTRILYLSTTQLDEYPGDDLRFPHVADHDDPFLVKTR